MPLSMRNSFKVWFLLALVFIVSAIFAYVYGQIIIAGLFAVLLIVHVLMLVLYQRR